MLYVTECYVFDYGIAFGTLGLQINIVYFYDNKCGRCLLYIFNVTLYPNFIF